MLLVTHELLHWQDSTLKQFAYAGGMQDLELRAERATRDGRSFASLTADERAIVYEYLRQGLHRGLWAEIRAWIPTFEIYLAAVQQGIWKHVPWMDGILGAASTADEIREAVFRHLTENAIDPTSEIYSRPAIREPYLELKHSRDGLRHSLLSDS